MQPHWAMVVLLACAPAAAAAQAPAEASAEPRPQVRLGGYIQYDFLAPIGDGPETHDTFRFRRVRLTGAGTLTKKIEWALSVEATSTPILRDAYITLKHVPAATVRVGQLVMPFGLEQYVLSSNTMAFTERINTELTASRDAGVIVSNERPFFGWLHYAAAVTNGTRQNVPDNNSAKDGVVRLTAAPARLAGFQMSVSAMKGDQPDGMRTRTGADVSFERRLFHVAAEFAREHTPGASRKQGGYVLGAWRVYPRTTRPGFHHLEFGTRFAQTKNLAKPGNQWDLSANYYVRDNVRFMCNLTLHRDRVEGTPASTFNARANVRF